MFERIRRLFGHQPATDEQKAANLARLHASTEAKLAPARAAAKAHFESEYRRINYYESDPAGWARWEAAGKPFIDATDVDGPSGWHVWATPCPTPEEWAAMTPEERGSPGLWVRK